MQQRRFAGFEQIFDFFNLKCASTRRFAHGEFALRAGETTVVFFDHATAIRTRRFQRSIVARHGVGFVFFGTLDDDLRHFGDFAHEGIALQFAPLHLREFIFPVTRQFGRGQLLHAQTTQQREQLKRFGRRVNFASFAHEVFLGQQPFDDRGARRGRAQSFAAHGFFQFGVIQQFARAFHRREQSRLGVARRWAGLQGFRLDFFGLHGFVFGHRHQHVVVFLLIAPVNHQPARVGQYATFGFEMVSRDLGHACGDHEFGGGEKYGHEAFDHQIVEFLLRFGQMFRRL